MSNGEVQFRQKEDWATRSSTNKHMLRILQKIEVVVAQHRGAFLFPLYARPEPDSVTGNGYGLSGGLHGSSQLWPEVANWSFNSRIRWRLLRQTTRLSCFGLVEYSLEMSIRCGRRCQSSRSADVASTSYAGTVYRDLSLTYRSTYLWTGISSNAR